MNLDKVLEYSMRSIIRYLDGDVDLFKKYKDKAMKIYEYESGVTTIGELIPDCTKKNLYEMVS